MTVVTSRINLGGHDNLRSQPMKAETALQNAKWANDQYLKAAEKTEQLRIQRSYAIVRASRTGATQAQISEELGTSQQAIGSIISRTKPKTTP